MTGRYYKEALDDKGACVPTALRAFNNHRVSQAIAHHMAEARRKAAGQPKTMVDAKGRVWHASNSEGVPTWVSAGYDPYPTHMLNLKLKPLTIAVKVAVYRS